MTYEEKVEIIKKYINCKTTKEISEMCDCSAHTIARIIRQEGMKKIRVRKKAITDEQIAFIRNNKDMETLEIAKILGVSKQLVYHHKKKCKIKKSVKYNKKMFEQILNIFKAKNTAFGKIRVDFKILLNLARMAKAGLIKIRKEIDNYYIVEILVLQ